MDPLSAPTVKHYIWHDTTSDCPMSVMDTHDGNSSNCNKCRWNGSLRTFHNSNTSTGIDKNGCCNGDMNENWWWHPPWHPQRHWDQRRWRPLRYLQHPWHGELITHSFSTTALMAKTLYCQILMTTAQEQIWDEKIFDWMYQICHSERVRRWSNLNLKI